MIRIAIKILLLSVFLGLCSLSFAKTKDPADPLEGLNRQVFLFNYQLDRVLYRPIAKLYTKITHPALQEAISNIINNIDEIPSIANDLLQLDGHHLVVNTWRLVINSTLGLLGTVDVASRLGLPPYKNDFGLTLYKWGVRKSPYLQVIFLGPSTVRDAIGMGIDLPLRPTTYIGNAPIGFGVGIFRGIPARAELLSANQLIDEAIDPYLFVKDAYLQKRKEDIRKMKAHHHHQK